MFKMYACVYVHACVLFTSVEQLPKMIDKWQITDNPETREERRDSVERCDKGWSVERDKNRMEGIRFKGQRG